MKMFECPKCGEGQLVVKRNKQVGTCTHCMRMSSLAKGKEVIDVNEYSTHVAQHAQSREEDEHE